MTWRPVSDNKVAQAAITVCVALMTACTSAPEKKSAKEPTIADISTESVAVGLPPLTGDTQEQAIQAYLDYLDRYPASPVQLEVMRRVADLLVERAADERAANPGFGEDRTPNTSSESKNYADAIAIYEKLLARDPDDPTGAQLRYQLARAYEESGQAERARANLDRLIARYPDIDVRLYADAQFRRGELLFTERSFPAAERSYRSVVQLGESAPVYEQALYKLGWSLFKQNRYSDALDVFFVLLDRKIPLDAALSAHLATLSGAEQEQVRDVFRAISLSFSDLAGADSIAAYFNQHGSRTYEERTFRDLAELYASKEFFTDAAETYLALAQRHPLKSSAPRLYIEAIRLYQQAELAQSTLETQSAFVRGYGMNSAFWDHHSPDAFPDVLQHLQSSLIDLAGDHHARARERQAAADYPEAERWYRTYLAWFEDAARTAEMNFQLAQLLYDSGQYQPAVIEYERTAYSRGKHPWAAEAGHSALLTYERYIKTLNAQESDLWSRRFTASALRFADVHSAHPDAPAALARAGADLLDRDKLHEAIRVSETILHKQDPAPTALRQTAWSILAQARFKLGDYRVAEKAYGRGLESAKRTDPRRSALKEGVAAAIYKQAEGRLARGDKREAVALFLRAANAAPESSVHAKSQFDAAAALLSLEEWADAARILEQFRDEHPQHRLQDQVSKKLALAYQRSGRYRDAASEYLRVGQSQGDDVLRREALVRAADLYEQAGKIQDAVGALELYTTQFPHPTVEAIEVLQKLADLEQSRGDEIQRRHWLRKVIVADRTSENARSERTRSLAAQATLHLAEEQLASFQRIRLVEPLKYNLDRKLQQMKLALKTFEEAIGYEISSIATAATYKIANMYDQLSRALLTSERPGNLGANELAQYDLLLEKQAAPFQQKAMAMYATNLRRVAAGQYDPWIEKSRKRLEDLRQRHNLR